MFLILNILKEYIIFLTYEIDHDFNLCWYLSDTV